MKRKAILIAGMILLALLLLIPVPMRLKDGGTVEYTALLYKVSRVHSLADTEKMAQGKAYNDGLIIEILGIEVFNNVE